MQRTFNELCITPSNAYDYFIDFIFSFDLDAVEEKGDSIIIRSEEDLSVFSFAIGEYAKKLSEKFQQNIELDIKSEKKENEDWIQKYKDSIQPLSIGNFYIRPDWEAKQASKIDIVINPALAFGSGHHESTYSCILQLEKYLKKDDTLMDVGCGSGILGIVAAKLGAKVDICDTDEQAIRSARENFYNNKVDFNLSWVGSIRKRSCEYDVIVANIIADVLIMLSSDLMNGVRRGGFLILSGILERYIQRVETKFSQMKLIDKYKKNEWYTLVLKRQ